MEVPAAEYHGGWDNGKLGLPVSFPCTQEFLPPSSSPLPLWEAGRGGAGGRAGRMGLMCLGCIPPGKMCYET